MFLESLLENVRVFFKSQRALPPLLLIIGFAVSGYGVTSVYAVQKAVSSESSTEVVTCPTLEEKVTSQVISVVGAVAQPGLYRVQEGSRVGEVLEQAGGLLQTADSTLVQKTTNFARKVQDGESIFIPSVKERELALFCSTFVEQTTAKSVENENQMVSINEASLQQLEALQGVGEKTAQAIIAGRPYTTVGELLDKKILSQSLFTQLEQVIHL